MNQIIEQYLSNLSSREARHLSSRWEANLENISQLKDEIIRVFCKRQYSQEFGAEGVKAQEQVLIDVLRMSPEEVETFRKKYHDGEGLEGLEYWVQKEWPLKIIGEILMYCDQKKKEGL